MWRHFPFLAPGLAFEPVSESCPARRKASVMSQRQTHFTHLSGGAATTSPADGVAILPGNFKKKKQEEEATFAFCFSPGLI